MSKRRRWTRKPKEKSSVEIVKDELIVAICIPSGDMLHAAFTMSLVHLIMHTMMSSDLPIRGLTIQHTGASILPHSRYTLVKRARAVGATHLLFLDSDMTFPPDTLIRFLKHDKDMIGVNAMSRRPPYHSTAWKQPGERIVTTEETTGLEKVWRTGLAVALIKSAVFDHLTPPYFEFKFRPETDEFIGEDYLFFDHCQAAGIELYVDHDVSKDVDHIGSFPFNVRLKHKEFAGTS